MCPAAYVTTQSSILFVIVLETVVHTRGALRSPTGTSKATNTHSIEWTAIEGEVALGIPNHPRCLVRQAQLKTEELYLERDADVCARESGDRQSVFDIVRSFRSKSSSFDTWKLRITTVPSGKIECNGAASLQHSGVDKMYASRV